MSRLIAALADLSSARKDLIALAVLSVLVLGFLWRVILLGNVLLPLDEVFLMEPWKSETAGPSGPVWNPVITDAVWQAYPMASVAKKLRQGGNYFWDPYPMGGMPALARGDTFTHPVVVLLSHVTSVARAMSWAAVVTLLLGGGFTYLLLRELACGVWASLIGSLAFAFNGYLVGWLCLPSMAGSMAWLPAIAWAIERSVRLRDWRWSLAGAVAFALQIFSGNILWSFYSALTVCVWLACRAVALGVQQRNLKDAVRPLLHGGVALVIGAGLAAVPLLLTLQLYFQTDRTVQAGANTGLSWGSHAVRLLAPTLYGNSLHGSGYWSSFNYAETNLYFGVLPLFLVVAGLIGRRRPLAWPLFALGMAALLAVYKIPPFRQIIAAMYPVFLNTFPGRIFFVIVFCWSVVAGLGADWLVRQHPRRALKGFGFAALALALAGLGLAAGIAYTRAHPPSDAIAAFFQGYRYLSIGSLAASAGFLAATSLTFLAWGYLRQPSRYVYGAVLVIIVADLFRIGLDFNPALDESLAFPETPSLTRLRALQADGPGMVRIATVPSGRILYGLASEVYQLETVSGYTPYALSRYARYIHLTQPVTTINHIFLTQCCSPLLDALNAKYVYAPTGTTLERPESLELIYDGEVAIYENTAALPRAWIVHRVASVKPGDLEAAEARLTTPGFAPALEAVVETDGELAVDARDVPPARARITRYDPERVIIAAETSREGLLVLSDAMYPGWQAYVDGQRAPIYYTNLFMRGVFLAAGVHQVEFVFEPELFRLGVGISLATIAGVAAALMIARARRSTPPRWTRITRWGLRRRRPEACRR